MTIEKSHGKARPTLVRSSDLMPDAPGTDRIPSEERDANGRAVDGNQIALGRGWKHAIRRTLGRSGATDEVARQVIADTMCVYSAIVRDLARTGPLVRMNAAGSAREYAYAGFYDAAALEAGLLTDKGQALAAKASQHRQRYERMTVTTRDLARATTPRKGTRTAAMTIRSELAKESNHAE